MMKKLWLVLLAVVLVFGLGLLGCSDSSSDDDDDDDDGDAVELFNLQTALASVAAGSDTQETVFVFPGNLWAAAGRMQANADGAQLLMPGGLFQMTSRLQQKT